ncbi:ankyrin repeat domain-containing protein [Flammeovirgaceae bacterium SG7u.111]|nr:ankyrin repeat domain-containing protein [Flammeovirgaceae bacterium SG7u.132]WPO37199.1 ankyrin repeat domain-containing protein [Flammeovirgaceae bacterium SG7u.111]
MSTVWLFALYGSSIHAQTSKLLNDKFWEAKPSLASVKTEMEKGFDFKNILGMEDPIVLAIRYGAPTATINYLLDQPGVDFARLIHEGRIYLHLVANKGNAEVVDHLLAKGSDMYFIDANGHTAFTYAGFQGHLTTDVIDVFIKHGIDLNKKYETKFGADILLISIPYDKDLKITDYFVSKGLSLNSTDDDGNTAFNHVAKIGYVPAMKELLKRGVKYNENALIIASQGTYRTANSIEVYKYLVDELKIDPKTKNKDNQNVLHAIAGKRNQAEIVSYFLDKGVDVNEVDKKGNTPFLNAASARSSDLLKLMYPHFKAKKINAQNNDGATALMLAASKNDANAVAFLIEKGADPKLKNKEGNDVGYYLVEAYRPAGGRRGRPAPGGQVQSEIKSDPFSEKLEILKKSGYDVNTQQTKGASLLHVAAGKNDFKLIKTLVSSGMDVNQADKNGTTPLHIASMKATNDKILKYLVAQGANLSAKTSFGETVYDLASENEVLGKKDINVEFLKPSK